jgi:hypothetical protein
MRCVWRATLQTKFNTVLYTRHASQLNFAYICSRLAVRYSRVKVYEAVYASKIYWYSVLVYPSECRPLYWYRLHSHVLYHLLSISCNLKYQVEAISIPTKKCTCYSEIQFIASIKTPTYFTTGVTSWAIYRTKERKLKGLVWALQLLHCSV